MGVASAQKNKKHNFRRGAEIVERRAQSFDVKEKARKERGALRKFKNI